MPLLCTLSLQDLRTVTTMAELAGSPGLKLLPPVNLMLPSASGSSIKTWRLEESEVQGDKTGSPPTVTILFKRRLCVLLGAHSLAL